MSQSAISLSGKSLEGWNLEGGAILIKSVVRQSGVQKRKWGESVDPRRESGADCLRSVPALGVFDPDWVIHRPL
jgi:hypothetical protein